MTTSGKNRILFTVPKVCQAGVAALEPYPDVGVPRVFTCLRALLEHENGFVGQHTQQLLVGLFQALSERFPDEPCPSFAPNPDGQAGSGIDTLTFQGPLSASIPRDANSIARLLESQGMDPVDAMKVAMALTSPPELATLTAAINTVDPVRPPAKIQE